MTDNTVSQENVFKGKISPGFYRFFLFFLVFSLTLGLIAAGFTVLILAGMLSFTVMDALQRSRFGQSHGRSALGVFFFILLALMLLFLVAAGVNALLGSWARFGEMMVHVSAILQSLRTHIPDNLAELLPQQQDLMAVMARGVGTHAGEIGAWGIGTLKQLGYLFIGLLIGLLMALDGRRLGREQQIGLRSLLLLEQCHQLRLSFSRIAVAQVRIASINTLLTVAYLLIALPIAGIHLPFAKTLVLVTFFGGMIPILGNLISNTVILVLSLSVSPSLSLVSLGFLVAIHKLEYFVNARIMGTRIHSKVWEMLLAMIVLERLLGLPGVVMAPILYAWLRDEWLCFEQRCPSA